MADDMPEPIAELAALAAQHHELYTAWVSAGFTEHQALELLKTVILANPTGGSDA
ncbi:hypothetical protein OG352_05440 [Streptomyces sp. NBC_01485]|uniref:hypothetical protein n=1 Tax=Streptomyces sp. NBC_01485 TaxID=2903884 RepID=UPI002E338BC1|nr:hypothetical protein [Streptomyces sp. NBC_01485]